MSAQNFIIATAGHVDHGKSALVKALTGTDPDRLPEEKARGITIDLGFAELNLTGSNGETIRAGIVDVPGHEDFVKNMIAGVGSVDLALFVVAADDGWMPQTEEHLQILTYLGVKRAVIALTKSDLAGASETATQIRGRLTGTPFERASIVETSIVTGGGLDQLKESLRGALLSLAPQRDVRKPRLCVDRVFSLHGIGTVVTGTLTGGLFAKNQSAIVQPQAIPARIRSIQSHNREEQEIGPGTRTALNLPDLDKIDIARGDVVTIPELGEPIDTIDALLQRLNRPSANLSSIKNGVSIYLHHGTARVRARLNLNSTDLKAGQEGLAHLRLESPIFAFVGDRFVLRDPGGRITLAGGVVLDLGTNRDQFATEEQQQLLKTRAASPNDVNVAARTELQRDGAKQHVDLLVRSNFAADEISAAVKELATRNELVVADGIVANMKYWKGLRGRATAAVEKAHQSHPHLPGLELSQLRSELGAIPTEIFDALIVDLCQNGYTKIDNRIRRSEHRPALPSDLAESANKVRRLLSHKPFDPPARKQVASDPARQEALKFLAEQGELVEIGDDLVLMRKALTKMKGMIAEIINQNGPATVSEIRQALQSSRRVVVPLLEYLDRERFTQRAGDRRTLREQTVKR